ncbi:MAG: hypothetical protein COX62_03660 [Deltaproteobacteria bacterium CG_4_10_14_0_2_um_filter_43_8]|nr:MAG: hypothetical protein COV43_05745 [Deltaproteobacteria bacterium CG11_big_fil_rev_8_21_14_0_20_42_23]PJA20980.1 MAG: hypothetical protein COX62_03660 [Deltaproteobacteria bacterium CG_4_10_14_0_2_um_filter_43_8]PJC63668.1 MAG: hypothetical protein CO021_08265 [Deltaproteobacteria bacterium CG_4_9_14_0_2_um_filter_42_21]
MEDVKKFVLTIGGSDPSTHVGVHADLAALANCGVEALSAVTVITGHDENGALTLHPTPADVLSQQLSSACRNQKPNAVKIGLLVTQANTRVLVWFLRTLKPEHVVIDPILHSSSGIALMEKKAVDFYRQQLLSMATLITPNLQEASMLAGMQVNTTETMQTAAKIIYTELVRFKSDKTLPFYVLIKGGHLEGDPIDVLYGGKSAILFSGKRFSSEGRRGSGCRFSSALAASLAKGDDPAVAVKKAKDYMTDHVYVLS